ncbi:unnamed protein product [Calypogeia fissa]
MAVCAAIPPLQQSVCKSTSWLVGPFYEQLFLVVDGWKKRANVSGDFGVHRQMDHLHRDLNRNPLWWEFEDY